MTTYLKPNTPEWFEALKRSNRKQAVMTEQILSSAGREDVCSICGDETAADYELVGEQMAPGVTATLRLCEDCVRIRRDMHQENFVPIANWSNL